MHFSESHFSPVWLCLLYSDFVEFLVAKVVQDEAKQNLDNKRQNNLQNVADTHVLLCRRRRPLQHKDGKEHLIKHNRDHVEAKRNGVQQQHAHVELAISVPSEITANHKNGKDKERAGHKLNQCLAILGSEGQPRHPLGWFFLLGYKRGIVNNQRHSLEAWQNNVRCQQEIVKQPCRHSAVCRHLLPLKHEWHETRNLVILKSEVEMGKIKRDVFQYVADPFFPDPEMDVFIAIFVVKGINFLHRGNQ